MELYLRNLHEVIYGFNIEFKVKKQLSCEIISGINYIHSNSIIHRDLKPSNILLTESLHVKITDFGTSRFIGSLTQKQTETYGATPFYISPELFLSLNYSKGSDIYSLGIVLWELWEQRTPYYHIEEFKTSNQWQLAEIKIHQQNLRPKFTEIIEKQPTLKQLIETFWDKDENIRKNYNLEQALLIIEDLKE